MRESILIVDTPASLAEHEKELMLQKHYFQTFSTEKPEKAVEWLRSGKQPVPDLILMDMDCGEEETLESLRQIKSINSYIPVVVLVHYGADAKGMKALSCGAAEYTCKPVNPQRLYQTLQIVLRLQRMGQYITWLERRISGHVDALDMVGESAAFKQVVSQAQQLAHQNISLFITGENGTGKMLLARMIHGCSARASNPFVEVNCELLPKDMAADMLFGSDVSEFILGKIREADQGTLFLQKTVSLPAEIRYKLMQMLQSGVVIPRGSEQPIPVDVRLICAGEPATASQSAFNRDFMSLSQTQTLVLPPLRERKQDIPALAKHFLLVHATSENRYVTHMSSAAVDWLCNNIWPGNIAQLRNLIWRAVMMCERSELDVTDLQAVYRHRPLFAAEQRQDPDISHSVLVDDQGKVRTLRSVEQEAIRFAISQSGGCMSRAARSLGIGRSTLYRKVHEFSMDAYISRANQTTRPMMKVSAGERS